jgi:hypothetical protein
MEKSKQKKRVSPVVLILIIFCVCILLGLVFVLTLKDPVSSTEDGVYVSQEEGFNKPTSSVSLNKTITIEEQLTSYANDPVGTLLSWLPIIIGFIVALNIFRMFFENNNY